MKNTKLSLEDINTKLDRWIKDCEEQAEVFNQSKMTTAEISSQAMATAYRIVKNFLQRD